MGRLRRVQRLVDIVRQRNSEPNKALQCERTLRRQRDEYRELRPRKLDLRLDRLGRLERLGFMLELLRSRFTDPYPFAFM